MRFSRVLTRFLIGYLILHLLMVGLFVIVLSRTTRNNRVAEAKRDMKTVAHLLRSHVRELPQKLHDPSLVRYLLEIGPDTGYRYTLITAGGDVLADSEKGTQNIGPHRDRPEIIEAAKSGVGFSERASATIKIPMMYFAIPIDENLEDNSGFIRVAAPSLSIRESVSKLQRWLWLFALSVSAVTGVLMFLFSSRMMSPLDEFSASAERIGKGDFGPMNTFRVRKDEWGDLASTMQKMQKEIAQRQQDLLANNQRMQTVLSSMIEGVLSTDDQGQVLLANRSAGRMLSLSQSELIGFKLLDVVRYPSLQHAIEQAYVSKKYSKAEFETTDEPRRILQVRVSALTDEGLGVAVVLHDVTEIRVLETMRRDFAANVSHELKTPLASIKAYAETLRLGALHDQEKNVAFVEQIESQADLLNAQIHDLLELARIESTRHDDQQMQSVSVVEVCQSCTDQLEAEASRRKVQLIFSAPHDPNRLLANGDVNGLSTIVKNLLSNAIHYTPQGGKVTLQPRLDGPDIVISVTDTGIGIAAEHHARIFERFYRVDKARSRDKGGTGLGLAIVKHLTQSFGGSVNVKSQIGKGTTFEVRLPVHKS